MIFKICLISSFLHTLGGFAVTAATTAQGVSPLFNQTKISECAAKGGECDENKGRPVCGTDNQTYPTRCHLIRAQCSGYQVSFKHIGTCKDACLASRAYALAHRKTQSQSKETKFIPKCRSDGSYAPVQCHGSVGCWCVNPQGKPIPNTRVDYGYGRPTCAPKSKSNQRRSSPRKVGVQTKKNCLKEDRIAFNGNVIRLFIAEYTRSRQNLQNDKPVTLSDKLITDWKFAVLDSNHNRILEKYEYRELKRIVKKLIKPKRCARSFMKFCDTDRDERITRHEWSNCLAKEFSNDDFDEEIEEYEDHEDYANFDGGDVFSNNRGSNSNSNNHLGATLLRPADSRSQSVFLLQSKTTLDLKRENDPGLHENESESDCLSDRLAAEEEQRAGSQAIYIPECTVDGRYQRIQCYKSEWCWCVNEDTGKNIPGTSTKNKRPVCDSTVTVIRPMKGCPEPRKTEFLRDLKEYLKTKLPKLNFESELWSHGNEDELIATKIFVYLDKNKNKLWERKEWKTFRELVMPIKNLRKCGKKMPRYCDVNSDRKITLTEWINCLQAQRISSHTSMPTAHDQLRQTTRAPDLQQSSKLGRIGQNPFDSILKSD